jgi:cell division protein FtsN
VSEREQSGRTVFRVRIGPMESREEAERIQQKLVATKVDAALVRVQR